VKNTHKMVAALAGAALLMAAVVVVLFWAFNQIEKAAEMRKHSSIVLNSANALLSDLKDAESGMRGYLLTDDEAFLETYLAVRDSIDSQLEELHQLTLISAADKHLDALTPLVDAKMAHLSQAIDLNRNHDMAAALAVVSSGLGRQLMDSIRTEMNSFIQIEEATLAQHEAEFQSNMRFLFIVIVIASLLTLLFALAFAYLIYRETQQRLKNLAHLETQHLLEIQRINNCNRPMSLCRAARKSSQLRLTPSAMR
jgi:CHASE3 domain sensor protein